MRSQQDGQVLSYVNDQIRRRYHQRSPRNRAFFVLGDRGKRLKFALIWGFDNILTTNWQQGCASHIYFFSGFSKKRIDRRYVFRSHL